MLDTMKIDSSIDLSAIEAELRPQSTEKLKFRFFECYGGAAKLIAEAAICVKLLKERGDNMTGVPMVGTFLRIASGQIRPELVWKFIESPNRHIVERLPLEDQKRLAADSMVEVVEPKPDGGFTKRRVDLTNAPKEIARLVVGPEGIRTPEEQLAAIGPQKTVRVVADRKAVNEDVAEEPLAHRVEVRLTESEFKAVGVMAAKAGITKNQMLRRLVLRGLKASSAKGTSRYAEADRRLAERGL